ncbi:uncharacterized protein TRIADDRAFT_60506 [Trichoplax adhaerens]|uniref:Uncharacterized protein n=1 Tax=Trichoplax adhaerens TaxID=10228 RepID=B3S8E0_TRIAD|nr:hypothetical protein TRIADDRAFT_60506 [Trichoplax adhaerens]EDV20941.1 hypothetical protein TRIADDRAFT_60506 [Trichoplax adhaerens]|eukprot:XP_002116585.1 hypothetical protein TRIADDRAFT_60506 [Trichoplax adhaerens]
MAHTLDRQNFYAGAIVNKSNHNRNAAKIKKAAVTKTDALLDHQIKFIKEKQEQILQKLDTLTNGSGNTLTTKECDFSESQIQLMQSELADMVIMLQTAIKIRLELTYSKKDLENASEESVNVTRTRVRWLEERLETILEKIQIKETNIVTQILKVEKKSTKKKRVELPAQTSLEKVESRPGTINGNYAVSLSDYSFPHHADSIADYRRTHNIESAALIHSEEDIRSKSSQVFITEFSSEAGISDGFDQLLESQHLHQSVKTDVNRSVEYWLSEHHQFERIPNVYEDNLLSWHTLPIAVPSTHVKRHEFPAKGLALKISKHAIDAVDIHNMALEKLSRRVRQLCNALYDVAQDSISPPKKVKKILKMKDTRIANLHDEVYTKNEDYSKTIHDDASHGSVITSIKDSLALPYITHGRTFSSTDGQTEAGVSYRPQSVSNVKYRITKQINQQFPQEVAGWYRFSDDLGNIKRVTNGALYDEPVKEKVKEYQPRQRTKSIKAVAKMQILGSRTRTLSGTNKLSKPKIPHDSKKWERIEDLIQSGLASSNATIRFEGAKNLGLLDCNDRHIVKALAELVKEDDDKLVRYEASKSMLLIGSWEDCAMLVLTKFLRKGNTLIKRDIMATIMKAKDIQYIIKKSKGFQLLKLELDAIAGSEDEDLSYQAALCLGRMCVSSSTAKQRLLRCLDIELGPVKAKALETLIKQFNVKSSKVIENVLQQLQKSSKWAHRVSACRLLGNIGRLHALTFDADRIFIILQRLLWDDPSKEVRKEAAETVKELKLKHEMIESIFERLEDASSKVRAQAVKSLATLKLDTEKDIKILLEIVELDSSIDVRVQAIRAFSYMMIKDKRVIKSLRDRQKGDVVLAKFLVNEFVSYALIFTHPP